MHRNRRVALAGRVPRLSATFRRSLTSLGIQQGSSAYRAVFATIGALTKADRLPGVADGETRFAPTRAFVRRVTGQNIWILYRFDDNHVYVMTARGEPPVPVDS